MKRSGQVGLVAMGAVAFVGTYAATSTYMARPGSAQAAQSCTTRPDGTQNCEPTRRSFTYHLFPHWSWGAASATPMRTQDVALTGNARPVSASYQPAGSAGTQRGGFGATARSGSFFTSAGG